MTIKKRKKAPCTSNLLGKISCEILIIYQRRAVTLSVNIRRFQMIKKLLLMEIKILKTIAMTTKILWILRQMGTSRLSSIHRLIRLPKISQRKLLNLFLKTCLRSS